jgi:hypothetical protein
MSPRDKATRKRRLRITVLRLLAVTLLAALASSFITRDVHNVKKQAEAIRWIQRETGGKVSVKEAESIWAKLFLTEAEAIEGYSAELMGAEISTELLAKLSRIRGLVFLSLRDTELEDKHIPFLTNMSDLESLHLDNTRISDEAIRLLSKLPKLRIIGLTGTSLTVRALDELVQFKHLEEIYIDKCQLLEFSEEIHKLAEMEHLTSIDVSGAQNCNPALLQSAQKQLPNVNWSPGVFFYSRGNPAEPHPEDPFQQGRKRCQGR